ncbi:hypothetical protein [Sodalinema gerasimenkoae]|uniref:hypothetical protein n=1 Tax=Sodalinema gerasimenkoae TaxID=2862348 RepID=UPI00135AAFA1|nr:hypothetical protein [Sodalinema gerasimenkoae]
MTLCLCPGVHSPSLTERLCQVLGLKQVLIVPTSTHPPYSPLHVLDFARQQGLEQPCFLAFSAGVVGAMGAACLWQQQGGTVKALIAMDGWGVPHLGDFPLHRLSHDLITDQQSGWLGVGGDRFYADPPVAHLDLWAYPERAQGVWLPESGLSRNTDAAAFIRALLRRYGELDLY